MITTLAPNKIRFGFDDVETVVARYFLPKLKTHNIFTFQGPLGAGKTTLIKSFLHQAGVTDVVTSPTFTYVQTYKTPTATFHHFDLYRLQSLDSFLEMGFDEYLPVPGATDTFVVIEWPEIILEYLEKSDLRQSVVVNALDYLENALKSGLNPLLERSLEQSDLS